MKLTIQTKDKTVIIETPYDDHTMSNVFDELLLPAILAFGYQQSSIDDYIAESAMVLNDNVVNYSEEKLDLEDEHFVDA